MYLLSVSSVSSRYFNKIKRTSYLGKLPALSLEILDVIGSCIYYINLCFLSRQATSFRPVETKESQVVKIDASKVCTCINRYLSAFVNRADSDKPADQDPHHVSFSLGFFRKQI